MASCKLKLNPDKTEFIVFGPKNKRDSLLKYFPIDIMGNKISPTDKVRNLGVIFHSGFTFSDQVNLYGNRVSIIYVILPEFGVIYLNQLQLHWPMRWLVVGLIIVTHFCPVYLSKILFVFKVFKIPFVGLFADFLGVYRPNVDSARRSLHWLPVKQQIQFINFLLTYKSLHTSLPPYLNSALIPFASPFHSTRRSSPANLILSTVTCNSSHTSKSQLIYSFDYIAPTNWNSLPDIVRLAPSVLNFVKGSKRISFGRPFPLNRHSFFLAGFFGF